MRTLALLILSGCGPKGPPSALPDASEAQLYKVGVVAANGQGVVTSITTLRVVPKEDSVWAFMTTHAEGTWEEGAAAMTWDSATPKGSDPWPVTLQHAVATVPASVRMTPQGEAKEMVSIDDWTSAARASMVATQLPPQASVGAASLLDPDGVLRDIRRNFPGMPQGTGVWVRDEMIAGLPAQRQEMCTLQRTKSKSEWACQGKIAGPTDGSARLVDGTSTTRLEVDAQGLALMSTAYEATLVMLGPDGREVIDRPVAGRRQVVRAPK